MANAAHNPWPKTLAAVSFYGILDSGYVAPERWLEKYDALVAGGAGMIQIRAKREGSAARAALLDAVMRRRMESAHSTNHPPLIVNDDLELCLCYPDLGLHVGQDDIPAAEARRALGPDRILGLSTHSPEQALQAIALGPQTLSYFAVGPVFATRTKPDYTPVGLELARYVVDQTPPLPFFCIGGINRSNLLDVAGVGVSRVVIVSDVLLDTDTASAVRHCIALIRNAADAGRA